MSDLRCKSCGQDVDMCRCHFQRNNNGIIGMCNGCKQAFGNCMCKFKTIHENQVMINPPKEDINKQPDWNELLTKNELLGMLKQLNKYQPTFEGLMEESVEFGEYILLSDILALFSREKE